MASEANSDWEIRRAYSTDARGVTECAKAAYLPYMERMGGGSLPPMTIDYRREIEESEVWVAESQAEVIGLLVLSEREITLQIANIAVHPASQGKGVGKGLINFAVDEARKRGRETVDLVTHPLLEENLSLYAHLGWSETGRDESHVYMTRDVT